MVCGQPNGGPINISFIRAFYDLFVLTARAERAVLGPVYTIPDYFPYRINFHSEVKNNGTCLYTVHAASLCCQLMSHCCHGNK
jgi:hypothetical protein